MVQFLGQAKFQVPQNADVSQQLGDLGSTIKQGIETRRSHQDMLEIGKAYESGDIIGATQMAFQRGRPDIGMQMSRQAQAQANADRSFALQQNADARAAAAEARAGQAHDISMQKSRATLDFFAPQGGAPAAPTQAPSTQPASFMPGAPAVQGAPATAPTMAAQANLSPDQQRTYRMIGLTKGAAEAEKYRRETLKMSPEYLQQQEAAKLRAKKQADKPRARQAAQSAIQKATQAATEAIRLRGHKGLDAAVGPVASKMPTFSTETANFETDLDTLKTKVFISAIAEMRALSKTGGAVGQVSTIELHKLENSMRNLDLAQGEGNMRGNLRSIAGDFNDAMSRVAEAYERDYGERLDWKPIDIPADKQPGRTPIWSWN